MFTFFFFFVLDHFVTLFFFFFVLVDSYLFNIYQIKVQGFFFLCTTFFFLLIFNYFITISFLSSTIFNLVVLFATAEIPEERRILFISFSFTCRCFFFSRNFWCITSNETNDVDISKKKITIRKKRTKKAHFFSQNNDLNQKKKTFMSLFSI